MPCGSLISIQVSLSKLFGESCKPDKLKERLHIWTLEKYAYIAMKHGIARENSFLKSEQNYAVIFKTLFFKQTILPGILCELKQILSSMSNTRAHTSNN